MAKKKKAEEHENLERWLVSYADFITLLFAFFVVMYSISSVNEGKFRVMAEALQAAFLKQTAPSAGMSPHMIFDKTSPVIIPSVVQPISPSSQEAAEVAMPKGEREELERLKETLEKMIEGAGLKESVKARIETRGLVITFSDAVFFNSGSSEILPQSKIILDKVSDIISVIPNLIRVEGHSDNIPIKTALFPSNWELSTMRATTIVRYLISEHGFPPQKLSAAGYAEFRPVAPNNTPEGRGMNRRVDVVVLSSQGMKEEPK